MVVGGSETVNLMATEAGVAFWGNLLTHIVEGGRRTPKFQVERAIGPMLGFFLPRALSELLDSNGHSNGETRDKSVVITLAAEFPLKKPGDSKQSTNIDWLMYDTANNELLLVELKTEFASFQGEQLDRYLELATTANPWIGMKEDFDNICKVTKSPKYTYAAKQLREVLDNCPDVENARVRVVYLAPKATAAAFDEAVKKFKPTSALGSDSAVCFFFEDLARFANGTAKDDLAPYRDKLFSALTALDRDLVLDESGEDLTEASKKNYRGRLSLDEVLRNCKEDKSILVGFAGGSKALAQQDFSHLQNRLYKWDNAGDKGVGSKIQVNWIEAEQFLKIVEPILSCALHSDADVQRLASAVGDALRNNPKLTLGQIIERVSSDAPIPLGELSDDDLIKALAALAAPK